MEPLRRGVQRLGVLLKSNGKRVTTSVSARQASVAVKSKIIEGNNGERIFSSPYGDIDIPSMTVQEYVWRDVEKWPKRVALECGLTGRKYTYAEARDNANYVARSLRNMGLRRGDVVALILPNLPEGPIAMLGALEADIVLTTVNPIYTVDEISRQLRISGAKAIITCAAIAENSVIAAKASLPPNAPIIVVDDGLKKAPEGTIPFNDLITKGKTLPQIPASEQSPDNLAVLPYSSGTTGLPKGVMLTHRNLVSDMCTSDYSVSILDADHPHVIPAVLPMFHIYGMNIVFLPRLAGGGHFVTLPMFSPELFTNVLTQHQCTLLYCVPPMVLFFGASPLVKAEHFKYVQSIFTGAAPLSATDIDRFYGKVGLDHSALPFVQGYGLTECSGVGFVQFANSKYSSIGSPIANCETRLVDPITGQDVTSSGKTGEIWLRGPNIMKGYHNNEEATNETLQDGWLKTGDIAYFDDDFSFFITDRLKELIKVKGFQVPPAELEGILRTHPDIQDAAVVGVPDPRSGEVPKAFVVLKKDKNTKPEDIQNFLKGKVSEYKELKGGVEFITEIPRNAAGKILRIQLKNPNK